MFTAECVTPKHPDKMCDQISDAILDLCLERDSKSRVAVEVMGGHGKVYITGEITSELGLTENEIRGIVHRITGGKEEVFINLVEQSPEIANGVDTGGAGDQGIMIGYACKDNGEYVPQEYYLARSLCKFLYDKFPYDGKTQVTMNVDGAVTSIVASFQNVSSGVLSQAVTEWIQKDPTHLIEDFKNTVIYANPAGDWNIGGFDADTGLTGRKIIVDQYGPNVPIGGGAFSGKDPSKVDRSGAYMARRIAVDFLKRTKADDVEVKLAYAIGKAEPVMAVAMVSKNRIVQEYNLLNEKSGSGHLTPNGIREYLKLDRPQYEETAKWGHFGNGFEWDKEEV